MCWFTTLSALAGGRSQALVSPGTGEACINLIWAGNILASLNILLVLQAKVYEKPQYMPYKEFTLLLFEGQIFLTFKMVQSTYLLVYEYAKYILLIYYSHVNAVMHELMNIRSPVPCTLTYLALFKPLNNFGK